MRHCLRFSRPLLGLLIVGSLAASASAHFVWLVPKGSAEGATVHVCFSEDATDDDPELLKRLDGMQAWQVREGAEPVSLKLVLTETALSATLPNAQLDETLIIGQHDMGVMERRGSTFRLQYYAKSGPDVSHPVWSKVDCSKRLPLDVVPTQKEGQVQLIVRFQGRPVAGAEVKGSGPGLDEFAAETDAQGMVRLPITKPGLHSIRVRHIEPAAAEKNTTKEGAEPQTHETRYYTTVTLPVAKVAAASVVRSTLPPLEQTVTSFGGAVLNGSLYVYGGHSGGAHSYSNLKQGRHLMRLSLTEDRPWESLIEGPALQGLALVAHGDSLYRIGGFTAKNAEGEEHDLWSQADAAKFTPGTSQWTALPALPEPRSSHDVAVVGDSLYVVGGWKLHGSNESQWHETAWTMNLKEESPTWKPLPTPPFQRRALALAAHQGKLYVIGGMQQKGGATRRVDIYDPATKEWSQGPEIVGEDGMTGFGASAFDANGSLYVTEIHGTLQRLKADGSAWEVIRNTPTPRFFHRLLPVDQNHLLVVGGASMAQGKFAEIELLDVSPQARDK